MSVIYGIYDPFSELDRLFDNALAARFGGPASREHLKGQVDVLEDSEKNTVTASFELPGLKKEDVNIEPHGTRLKISGETKMESDHEEKGYAVRERSYGTFERVLSLPKGVKAEEVKADMENGMLSVCFPKTAAEQTPKRIMVV
ncbi:HSP20-like chaperone [Coniophora puteana RWD-64-598 SS2]|uniref:HSP20-like chaperone n=1 Tax=Coniophora puteana (strain RWD-64-598) TaxID=741705 RepID=A0A5M3MAT6_CONPW|nr:HSP20-like chaperone [Coniophora puteana RWD-64-598 SS2]EIW76392.1 HSP20-like chaperone [Coniophora puteana RWD-64-598 SS2]